MKLKDVEALALELHQRRCWVGPWCTDFTMEDELEARRILSSRENEDQQTLWEEA